jgi:hypothetical protein
MDSKQIHFLYNVEASYKKLGSNTQTYVQILRLKILKIRLHPARVPVLINLILLKLEEGEALVYSEAEQYQAQVEVEEKDLPDKGKESHKIPGLLW